MRLAILTEGLSFLQRIQLRLIKRIIGHEVGPIAMQSYRPEFFGRPFNECVAESLRGTKFWNKAEAELFAGFVSKQNQCNYCAGAHKAIAVRGYSAEAVEAALNDWHTAPAHQEVGEQVWAMLRFLEKLTVEPGKVAAVDIEPLQQAGISEEGVREAISICFVFCTINRLADAFEFDMPSEASYQRLGFTLYNMGYGLAVLPG